MNFVTPKCAMYEKFVHAFLHSMRILNNSVSNMLCTVTRNMYRIRVLLNTVGFVDIVHTFRTLHSTRIHVSEKIFLEFESTINSIRTRCLLILTGSSDGVLFSHDFVDLHLQRVLGARSGYWMKMLCDTDLDLRCTE